MRRLALFLCAASLTTGCVSIGIATLERDEIETAKRASAWARSPEAILRRQATMK